MGVASGGVEVPIVGRHVEYVRVGAFVEVPEGELRAYEIPAGRVAVAHLENRLFAIGDECTHEGCSLAEEGRLSESEDAVECAVDGSVFDLESGEPIEGPAEDRAAVFPVRVVDGWIEVGAAPGDDDE
jgi:3-phenylpropionate/trans-cinnamate dioxygenase ferredoxin component